MLLDELFFPEIWCVDYEFWSAPGENPVPACLVAWELRSGRKISLWQEEFGVDPPYPTGPDALFVAYYASAEIGCHLALGWPVPERVLDLFTEFRNHTNGLSTVAGAGATKATHKAVREKFKACVLAVQYGMGADALALRIGQPPIVARELLRLHRETYKVFWRWSDAAVDHAMLTGSLHTVFGWLVRVPENANPRSLRNFPMQANGAEMLRLACSLGTERGIEVCAPVHDAVLICAPLERLDADIAGMQDRYAGGLQDRSRRV
jgi:hypothetical protein